jgi:hypothetical protein
VDVELLVAEKWCGCDGHEYTVYTRFDRGVLSATTQNITAKKHLTTTQQMLK